MRPRTMMVAAAFTVTASLSVAALLAGGSAAPAAVAAEVQAAPVSIVPARPAQVVRAARAVAPASRPVATKTPVKVVRHVTVTPTVRTPVAAVEQQPAVKQVSPAPTTSTSVRDDYPFRTDTTNDSDTWGFTKRQCVSFAAFRLAQHGHAIDNGTQNWGSALTWDDAARRLGKTVTTRPTVGAVAQWNANESSAIFSSTGVKKGSFTAGGYGHVGYVAAVYDDGTTLIEQYNLGGDRNYSVMRMSAPRYIVF